MSYAAPFGDRRQDIRAAFHTAHHIALQSTQKIDEVEFSELVRGLSRYLKCDQDPEPEDETADMDALALMIKQQEIADGRSA
jgi:hypothetical protein